MAKFIVEGGHHLKGEITPQGAKNEALQIICATLLTSERVVLHNVPIISDVMQLLELLQRMGVKVERLSDDSFAIQADNVDLEYLRSADYHKRCRRLRGSVMMIGPLLTRFGIGFMPKPGGDKIGRRRLDTHFLGFQKLGADFNFDISEEFYTVEAKRLKGTYMLLDEASVTGTANIIMAAVLAEGKICAMMIATPLHEWHWVLITAIRKYPDGSRWLQIADGWHGNDLRYYHLEQEHDWISCTTLELK